MTDHPSIGWFRASLDAWMLGVEASTVVGLRMAKLAAGGDAAWNEGRLMIDEKVHAALERQMKLASAPFDLSPLTGTKRALRHYRGKVARNRRRLGG